MKALFLRLFWLFLSCFLFSIIILIIFMPIFSTNSLIFPYAITPFDICKKYPNMWITIKKLYWCCFFISYFIVFNYIYNNIQKNLIYPKKSFHSSRPTFQPILDNSIRLLVGTDLNNIPIYITEKGLYQNILITGTIGSR